MDTNEIGTVFWEYAKDHARLVRFSLREYKGHRFADFRVYWRSEEHPDWLPGKQGVTVPISQLPELRASLDEAIAATSESDNEKTEGKG
ncbi:MAG TPA: transcriptional coactivator p15/PC4 family protein [bacterium]|nr:transcriptional coactivator p15/PC4 family protein [bacterium]